VIENVITERNRQNAVHSTGPKSPEGKAKASQNARKWGVWVSDNTLEQENPEELADILTDYMGEYQPYSATQREYVRQLSTVTLRLHHLDACEMKMLSSPEEFETRNEANQETANNWRSYERVMLSLHRVRVSTERRFDRIVAQLHFLAERYPKQAVEEIEIEVDLRNAKRKPFNGRPIQNEPSEATTSNVFKDIPDKNN